MNTDYLADYGLQSLFTKALREHEHDTELTFDPRGPELFEFVGWVDPEDENVNIFNAFHDVAMAVVGKVFRPDSIREFYKTYDWMFGIPVNEYDVAIYLNGKA